MTNTEETLAYAQRRSRETGEAYIISAMGHVTMDHPINRQMLETTCGGVIAIVRSERINYI